MKQISKWIFLSLLPFVNVSLANTAALKAPDSVSLSQQHALWPLKSSPWVHPVATFTAGVASANVGSSHRLDTPHDSTVYYYDASDANSTRMLLGAFLGIEFPPCLQYSEWDMDLGLGYYQPFAFVGSGTLAQGMDPISTDFFNYLYKVKSQQLLAEGKFLWRFRERIRPYVLLGLGAAFNQAYDYEVHYNHSLTFTPLFSNNTTTQFSYSLGVGVDMDITKHWRFGLGYRFSDLGRAGLGSGVIDTTPVSDSLSQSHLYANEGVLQLSYIV